MFRFKKITLLAALLLIFISANGQGGNIRKFIEKLKKDSSFVDAVAGIMVMDSKGNTVASWNPDMPLLTASTMKTITTGIALDLYGADHKFTTKIAHSGFIADGVLYGDLYIVGGGDPTLGSKDTVAFPIGEVFAQWLSFIKDKGIKRINGHIVADDRIFEDEPMPDSWSWSNMGTNYGSTSSGLSFCENIQYFKFNTGVNIGDAVFFDSVYPEIPQMTYENRLSTAGSRTGDRSSYYVSDLSKIGRFTGFLPAGRDSMIVSVSNKFPALSCAFEFRKYLRSNGIFSSPEIKDAKSFNAAQASELTIIGKSESKELWKIVNVTNRISNNFFAETLLKHIGVKLTGVGSYDSSITAVKRYFKSKGLSLKGFTMADGSGLSRQNYVSARFFCNYFNKMKESNTFAQFFGSLPQPGGPGTLKNVLSYVEEKEEKERLHAKSGSLSSVKCYAGYVVKGKETYTFAILTNNYSSRTAVMMEGIEGLMEELIR